MQQDREGDKIQEFHPLCEPSTTYQPMLYEKGKEGEGGKIDFSSQRNSDRFREFFKGYRRDRRNIGNKRYDGSTDRSFYYWSIGTVPNIDGQPREFDTEHFEFVHDLPMDELMVETNPLCRFISARESRKTPSRGKIHADVGIVQ